MNQSTKLGSLSSELRNQTMTQHKEAEGSLFMRAFMKGTLKEESYLRYLYELYNIYEWLEEFLDKHKDYRWVKPIFIPELFRKQEIMKDIRYFKSRLGDVHQGNYSLFYTDHIKNLKDPYLIIAHSYVRYLGDLSGGQILKNIVQKNYHLEGEEGVSFYNFQNIKDISQFKVHYKNILDALDLDNDTKIEIIEEAKTVFQLNNQLFSKLDSFIGISSS